MLRFCCSSEQQQLQQVQAGLCQEILSAGRSRGRYLLWDAKISHEE